MSAREQRAAFGRVDSNRLSHTRTNATSSTQKENESRERQRSRNNGNSPRKNGNVDKENESRNAENEYRKYDHRVKSDVGLIASPIISSGHVFNVEPTVDLGLPLHYTLDRNLQQQLIRTKSVSFAYDRSQSSASFISTFNGPLSNDLLFRLSRFRARPQIVYGIILAFSFYLFFRSTNSAAYTSSMPNLSTVLSSSAATANGLPRISIPIIASGAQPLVPYTNYHIPIQAEVVQVKSKLVVATPEVPLAVRGSQDYWAYGEYDKAGDKVVEKSAVVPVAIIGRQRL